MIRLPPAYEGAGAPRAPAERDHRCAQLWLNCGRCRLNMVNMLTMLTRRDSRQLSSGASVTGRAGTWRKPEAPPHHPEIVASNPTAATERGRPLDSSGIPVDSTNGIVHPGPQDISLLDIEICVEELLGHLRDLRRFRRK